MGYARKELDGTAPDRAAFFIQEMNNAASPLGGRLRAARPSAVAIIARVQAPAAITVTYLELDDPGKVRPPAGPPPPGLGTQVVHDPVRNRDLYSRVGADYSWFDRLVWTERQWSAWASRVETHVLELNGQAIGYFELEPERSATKIAIFGLLGAFHGRGLGGHSLTIALNRALELKPRVWLTTCSLDAPSALPNYRARGLEVFKVEQRQWAPPAGVPRAV